MSRLLSLGLAFAMFFSGTALAQFSDTSSIPANQQAAINALSEKGLIEGYADGTFLPKNKVNRAEFLKVLVGAAGFSMPANNDLSCFKDFIGTIQWYWQSACAAKAEGLVNGYPDGTFRGDKFINVAEAMKIAMKAFRIPEPMYIRAPDHWYDPFMDAASGKGAFSGVRRDPSAFLTRAEMAYLVQTLSGNNFVCSGGHKVGDSYQSSDGCNSCSCTESGEVCTLRACQPRCRSSNECSSGTMCSTEWGTCNSYCPPNAICTQECYGFCETPPSL